MTADRNRLKKVSNVNKTTKRNKEWDSVRRQGQDRNHDMMIGIRI